MKTVGIICNKSKQEPRQMLEKLTAFFRQKGIATLSNFENSLDGIVAKSDLLISLGGDGTLLHLAEKASQKKVPVLGVHLGSLGFITDVKVEEVFEEIEHYLAGKSQQESRLMLEAEIQADSLGAGQIRRLALNDVVIHRESASQFIKVMLTINGAFVYAASGDGILVATPTGSTGYNLSCNGPIIHPTADSFVVTPICAHSLIQKSIVLAPQDEVTLHVESKEGSGAQLIIDGQLVARIGKGDCVVIKGAETRFLLVRNARRRYFDVLKEKFNWNI